MRIADKMTFDQVNRSIGKNRSEMTELQGQASSQKRVTKPSDDPVAATRVLSSRTDLRGNQQFIKNLDYAKGFLDFSEQSLAELTDILVRAKELSISQADDAASNPQSRKVVAQEVNQLLNQSIQIGNRKLGERFIFGGFKTTDAPFDENGRYKGDMGEMKIHIDKDSFLAMNMPGEMVFGGVGLSKDGFSYKDLPQPKNLKELNEQKTSHPENFGPTAIDRRGRKIVSAPESNKTQSSQKGEPMRGPASVRVSENAAPVTSSISNQNSENKKSNFPDGVNVFRALQRFEVALRTNDKEGVQESMDRLDDAIQQVVVARTSLGSRVSSIDNTLNSMHATGVDLKSNISELEDADAFQVISDINKTESALQATLQTSPKMLQKSLMDFIS